jgi:hypothetical protein
MANEERREGETRPGEPREKEPRVEPAKPASEPAPGVKHKPEPDAENIVPKKHEPGTF